MKSTKQQNNTQQNATKKLEVNSKILEKKHPYLQYKKTTNTKTKQCE